MGRGSSPAENSCFSTQFSVSRCLRKLFCFVLFFPCEGKGNEDKRGQSIALSVPEKSWLYLNGHPVTCDRMMEVAAIVSSINPAISATMDSTEMGALQQVITPLSFHFICTQKLKVRTRVSE